MFELLQFLMPTKLLGLIFKPVLRLIIGLIVAPLFRLFLYRVVRMKDLSQELERDLALWIRGSLLLLIATANMESFFFKWVPVAWLEDNVWLVATRLLLAMTVIEQMPDQALFSIIHPGPPKWEIDWKHFTASFRQYLPKLLKGLMCQHLNRSSPVLAILTVFLPGPIGWTCYGLAIGNYLIIGLMSSRDRALDVLQQFDSAVSERRQELVQELTIHTHPELSADQRLTALEQGGLFTAADATSPPPSATNPLPTTELAVTTDSPAPSAPLSAPNSPAAEHDR